MDTEGVARIAGTMDLAGLLRGKEVSIDGLPVGTAMNIGISVEFGSFTEVDIKAVIDPDRLQQLLETLYMLDQMQ